MTAGSGSSWTVIRWSAIRSRARSRWAGSSSRIRMPALPDGGLQLAAGARGDHPAVVDDRDPVGQLVGLVEVLGGEQHRRPVGHDAADDLPQCAAAARVQAGGRLVEEQQVGGDDDAGGEVQLAAHAARQPGGLVPRGAGEVERGEELARHAAWPGAGSSRAGGRAAPGSPRRSGRSSTDANCPVRLTSLAHGGGLADDVVAEHAGAAGVGAQQRGEDADRRRLAGAVRAEDAVDAAAGDGEVHAVDGARPRRRS